MSIVRGETPDIFFTADGTLQQLAVQYKEAWNVFRQYSADLLQALAGYTQALLLGVWRSVAYHVMEPLLDASRWHAVDDLFCPSGRGLTKPISDVLVTMARVFVRSQVSYAVFTAGRVHEAAVAAALDWAWTTTLPGPVPVALWKDLGVQAVCLFAEARARILATPRLEARFTHKVVQLNPVKHKLPSLLRIDEADVNGEAALYLWPSLVHVSGTQHVGNSLWYQALVAPVQVVDNRFVPVPTR